MAFDPLSLGLGAVTGGVKLGLAAVQAGQAARLKFSDTTTPEQREALAIARQRAAFGRLPGAGLVQSRLAQGQNTTVQNAMLGAGGSSDLLASVAAADRNRQQGELQLGAQGEQFNERAQGQLGQQLALQAQQRQRDLAAYNQQKAALIGGAIQNVGAAVDTGAAYAAYGANKNADALAADTSGYASRGDAVAQLSPRAIGLTSPTSASASPGIRGTALPGYTPSLTGGRYRTSSIRYGGLGTY